jgi:diketogulonate reductase-like aldo/keto reductase
MCVLATKYGKSSAQIGLRWMVQKQISVIPKSVHDDRIIANAQIFDFEIEEEDMAILDSLNQDFHSSQPPEDLRGIVL